jgi:hypothetical protein
VRKFLREHSLTVVFGLLFLGALVGQLFAGHADHNERQLAEGASTVGLVDYLFSADFLVDVAENWQSEYLQFFLYVTATVWLVQRGSPESKPADKAGPQPDSEQQIGAKAAPRWARAGGWRTKLYSNSLGLAMLVLFLLSWSVQSVAGWFVYNEELRPVSWLGYVTSPDFWNRSLQNWQSEFLAIASMAILSVYLRQHSSPESKPVGAPHSISDRSG